MTRRIALPTEDEVLQALAGLQNSHSAPVTVQGLAAHLGLTNPTFWRWFPEIAQEVADQRRATVRAKPTIPSETAARAENERALRAKNSALRDQIELAVAHIQRLSLENQALRAQLERQSNVIRLPNPNAD